MSDGAVATDALLLVDAQPARITASMTRNVDEFSRAVEILLHAAALHAIPVVATAGRAGPDAPPTVPGIAAGAVLWRTTLDAFADAGVRTAIEATGRRSLVIAGLATDIGVAAAASGALGGGYRVAVAVDACSATSDVAETATIVTLAVRGIRCTSVGSIVTSWLGDFSQPHARDTMALLDLGRA